MNGKGECAHDDDVDRASKMNVGPGDPLLSAANAAFASQRTATACIDSVPLLKRVNDSRVFFFDGPGHASSGRTEK